MRLVCSKLFNNFSLYFSLRLLTGSSDDLRRYTNSTPVLSWDYASFQLVL